MRDAGMGSWPRRRARMTPGAVAFVHEGERTTYATVEERVNNVAQGLRALGVERGERVAYLGLNSTDMMIVVFAVARVGAVIVPLNTRLAPPETAFILRDCAPRLLIWDEPLAAVATSAAVAELDLDTITVHASDGRTLASVEESGAGQAPLDELISLDDLFMIQYTSGTSGRPKGVMMTHGNITFNVYNVLVDLDLGSDERALVTAPLFHTAALNQVAFPIFLKGGTSYIEAAFHPGRTIDIIESERITVLFGVTAMYAAMTREPRWESADLSSLRIAESGGAPIPMSLLQAFIDRGLVIQQGYGLTEASPGTTFLRTPECVRKVGTAGTACFWGDVRVIRADATAAEVGEAGEIQTQGPNVTRGYWGLEQASADAFTDGWLRTGDLGRFDDDGFLTIVDRLKDMFVSGGENVYPAEVEAAISTHPAVAECAVIGVPDARWGEVGRAVVTLRDGAVLDENALIKHLDGRIARYKIPKSVVIVEALPRNGSGKLLKGALRDRFGAL